MVLIGRSFLSLLLPCSDEDLGADLPQGETQRDTDEGFRHFTLEECTIEGVSWPLPTLTIFSIQFYLYSAKWQQSSQGAMKPLWPLLQVLSLWTMLYQHAGLVTKYLLTRSPTTSGYRRGPRRGIKPDFRHANLLKVGQVIAEAAILTSLLHS